MLEAHEWTGSAAAEFSRIHQTSLGRFTGDRLMTILDPLPAMGMCILRSGLIHGTYLRMFMLMEV